jgi:hypothetical protein
MNQQTLTLITEAVVEISVPDSPFPLEKDDSISFFLTELPLMAKSGELWAIHGIKCVLKPEGISG